MTHQNQNGNRVLHLGLFSKCIRTVEQRQVELTHMGGLRGQLYLLSTSKGMVKAGHVGHDRSFIRLGGVDDIYGIETGETVKVVEREHENDIKVLIETSIVTINLL